VWKSGVPHTDEQAVLDRIRQGLVYTESEASFQAPRRRTDLIFEYNHNSRPGSGRVESFGAAAGHDP
jgi:hypothetical protein